MKIYFQCLIWENNTYDIYKEFAKYEQKMNNKALNCELSSAYVIIVGSYI